MTEQHGEKNSKAGHSHGTAAQLGAESRAVLERGLVELLEITQSLGFKPLGSQRYPCPLSMAVYGETPQLKTVRADLQSRMHSDPVASLELALVLLELYESNQPGMQQSIPDDLAFLNECFASKRLNGWISVLGDINSEELEREVNASWQFKFISGDGRVAGLYVLLNMLCRYGFVYGRIATGDSHAMGHFIEDFTPGLLVCSGGMTDLELTLSLAAMKLGVPAIVPLNYPFALGRRIRAESVEEIAEGVVDFPNIRRLLNIPGIPALPEYLDAQYAGEEFEASMVWGQTGESFYLLRKGEVTSSEVEVLGKPAGPLGVILTVAGEPLDAFDRGYIENRAADGLNMMHGVKAKREQGKLVVELAEDIELSGERLGQALIGAIRHEFPKLDKVRAQVIFDSGELSKLAEQVRAEQAERERIVASASEESIDDFVTCVGCSPFAPDHVCVLTPQRPPQCGRPLGAIKTGALYGYDDMSNIHHRALHSGLNSFGVCSKGKCIDAATGEWSGANEAAIRLTDGRTRRVQLHSLDEAPHTGCGCFGLVMFKTEKPRTGIGVMSRGYKGRTPDGRSWEDLHYSLAGKQAPGIAGASGGYLFSPKFLSAHGGWKSVVWVCPKIAKLMGQRLPKGVTIGPKVE